MVAEFTRLNHITVNAPSGSQDKVRWFYGKILGLKEVPIPPKLLDLYEIVWFQLLDFLLHIEFVKEFETPPENYENGAILPGRHIALEVKNIEHLRQELESHKVEIREAVPIPDRVRFYAKDPFGNFLEIIQFKK